jgi:hypothetical protein
MPLCPQITNTPITVTQTADFTVSSVLPVVSATTTQVRAAQSSATSAQATAAIAQAEAATAISTANTAIANAATANATAIAANTAAGVAQTTADGKNKVTYSTSVPGTTANAIGDIWYQYGTTSPNVGRIIAQYMGAGGTSWTQTTVSGLVIANIDAGNITTGTLTAAVGISNPSGNFSVNGATGALFASSAVITGEITATSGTFTGTVFASAGTFTGTITSSSATITGGSFTVGSAFQIASSGFLFASGAQIGPWYFGGGFIASNSDGTGNQWNSVSGALITNNISIRAASGTTGLSFLNGANILTGGGNITASGGTISASTGTITTQTLISTGTLSISGTSTMATINAGDIASSAGTITAGTNTSSSTSQTTGVFLSSTGAVIGRRDNQIALFAHRYNASGTSELIRLIYNGADAGGITTTSGGVPAFRNASDYRLKQNIQSYDSAASIVKQINLRSFEFIKDPEEPQVGFIAHELAEVLPALVMGEKDAIDEDGNPAYQSILATNLIPYLTGALKEAILRIEALEGE